MAFRLSVLIVCAALSATPVAAQPVVNSLDVRAMQIGKTTRLTFTGNQLAEDTQIVSEFRLDKQQRVDSASTSPGKLVVDVTVSDDAPVGPQAIRLLSSRGISSPLVINIDRFPNKPFAPKIESMPVAMSGTVRGAQVLSTTFKGTAGQKFVAEIQGRRGASKIRPVLRLHGPHNRQLQWSQPQRRLGGDTRLQITLPETGAYRLDLHDTLYKAPGKSFFRLKVGELQFADLAYPIAVQADSNATVTIPGSNLDAEQTVSFQASSKPGWHALSLRDRHLVLTTNPLVLVERHAVISESDAKVDEQPTETAGVPSTINGRLATPGEVDRYQIAVKPGQMLNVTMTAAAIGSPVDGRFVLKDADGAKLADNDDQPKSSDPALEFSVPEGTEQITLEVSDVTGSGGADHVYLVQVRDKKLPDFKLTADQGTINIPAGGTVFVKLQADRIGYKGPIKLSVEGLPDDYQIAGDTIFAGSKTGLLTVSAGETPLQQHVLSIMGESVESNDDRKPIRHPVRWGDDATSSQIPWLGNEFAFATAPASGIQLAGSGDLRKSLPDLLPLGGQVTAEVKIARSEGTKGKIRIRLETNQTPPQKKVRENNKDKVVDDVERTLRLAEPVELNAKTENASLRIMVPNDLPERKWAIAAVAELLSPDGKRVIEQTCLPTVYAQAKRQFRIRVTGKRRIKVDPASSKHAIVAGIVERIEGFNQPVSATLIGLPERATPPTVQVAADQTEFELPIELPADIKTEELKSVSLIARATDEKDASRILASSNRVKLSIALTEPRQLFNGTDLTGWEKIDKSYFKQSGDVKVVDGEIEIAAGKPGSGIIVAGKNAEELLRMNYRIEFEAKRVEGSDFFCGMTFPVGESYLTLILGGWGGTAIGLSNIDGDSAIENSTSDFIEFENGKWYRVRHEVTPTKIETWLDDEKIISVKTEDKKLDIWWEQEPVRPLGLSTWNTTARYRNIRVSEIESTDEETEKSDGGVNMADDMADDDQ